MIPEKVTFSMMGIFVDCCIMHIFVSGEISNRPGGLHWGVGGVSRLQINHGQLGAVFCLWVEIKVFLMKKT